MVEVVVDGGVGGDEFVRATHMPKAGRCALPSSQWQVAVFGSIIEMAAGLLPVVIADFTHGGGVRKQPVSDDLLRASRALHLLLQEGENGLFIASAGGIELKDFDLLVDGAP